MEASLVVRLFMAQTFEFASGLWCIGQLASDPWGQVHSASPPRSLDTTKAIGTSVSVAAWQKSHATAMRPRARRVRVMGVYVSAVRRLCQMRRSITAMRRSFPTTNRDDLAQRKSARIPRQTIAGQNPTTKLRRDHHAAVHHLSPAAIESAIRLLERPVSENFHSDISETGEAEIVTPRSSTVNGGEGRESNPPRT
jgi:hypothetical protein